MRVFIVSGMALLLSATVVDAKDNEKTVGANPSHNNFSHNESPNANADLNGSLQAAKKALQEFRKDPTADNYAIANESIQNSEENAGALGSERPLRGSGWSTRLEELRDDLPTESEFP
jgi:hypothetical protein